MRATLAAVAFAAVAAARPQAVTSAISPESSSPAGCSDNYDGQFMIQVVKGAAKRDLQKRQSTPLELTLADGVLTDAQGRTGYIADNYQFQFDAPPQAGAIYTSGFSVCQNGDLALGGNQTWYQCLSGDFYNLYNVNWAPQCEAVHIMAIGGAPVAGTTSAMPTASGVASVMPDGQPTASAVSQMQAPSGVVTQIPDGQIQGPPTPMASPITQIGDGQIQAPSGSPVTQISDGQIQAPTSAAAPVTQISDGQIQAPTGGAAMPTGTGATGPKASSYAPAPATGAASSMGLSNIALALGAGVVAVFAL